MKDSFKTIAASSEGLFKDKGSKFFSFAFPVSNEIEIKEIIEATRKKYHDARHHCFAWMLGEEKLHFRVSDDGEPSNSAGKPILGQIQAKDLSNVIIIVVRYFGGTLLGVGGLIQAYKAAAKEAIEAAHIIDKYIYRIYQFHFRYTFKEFAGGVHSFDQIFEMECSLKVRVKRSIHEKFEKSFELNHDIELKYIGEE